MDIPYTIEARPETGLNNGKLGMWLFLASEVMLFGGVFSAYVFLRASADSWPKGSEHLSVFAAGFNTVVLVSSSVTMVMSARALARGAYSRFRGLPGATMLLGIVFLGIKAWEYSHSFAAEHYPSTSPFFAIYFTLTGLHIVHLICGITVGLYFLLIGGSMWRSEPKRLVNRIEITGMYWQFVDLVWIVIFTTVYLL